jgi:hypothetical protein
MELDSSVRAAGRRMTMEMRSVSALQSYVADGLGTFTGTLGVSDYEDRASHGGCLQGHPETPFPFRLSGAAESDPLSCCRQVNFRINPNNG